MPVTIICQMQSLVPTRVGVIVVSSSTKPDSGVTGTTNILIVTEDANSCFGSVTVAADSVEPLVVTVGLQRSLGTNQRLSLVATQ